VFHSSSVRFVPATAAANNAAAWSARPRTGPSGAQPAGASPTELALLVAALDKSLDDLAARLDQRLAEMAANTVEMALAVAGEVIGSRVEAGALDLAPIVRGILTQAMEVDRQTQAVVHVAGDDLAHLVEKLGFGEPGKADGARVRFHVDPSIARGAVRVEAGKSTWSYDPRTVIERLRAECRGATIA
jgi:flagellar biosynthesis/type III secretory pathway protein FliH